MKKLLFPETSLFGIEATLKEEGTGTSTFSLHPCALEPEAMKDEMVTR